MVETRTEPSSATRELAKRLSGDWRNQLGSQLHLVAGEDGSLSGTYHSGTGDPIAEVHPLAGRVDLCWATGTAVLGFVVSWPAAHSVTAWSGRFEPVTGEIEAIWVMATEAEGSPAWMGSRVGHDRFHRDVGPVGV
jgi:hypothetical protein